MTGLLGRLAAIVGERNVLTDEASMTPYVNDWVGKYHGSAQAVVRPRLCSGGGGHSRRLP